MWQLKAFFQSWAITHCLIGSDLVQTVACFKYGELFCFVIKHYWFCPIFRTQKIRLEGWWHWNYLSFVYLCIFLSVLPCNGNESLYFKHLMQLHVAQIRLRGVRMRNKIMWACKITKKKRRQLVWWWWKKKTRQHPIEEPSRLICCIKLIYSNSQTW